MSKKYIIIGNGVAGDSAASVIRQAEQSADIQIFTTENHSFYYRPRLVEYLSGEVDIPKFTMHTQEWYEQQGITLNLLTKIIEINPGNKTIKTETSEYSYDKLLLACGAKSFIPPIEGINKLKKCFPLRTIEDTDNIIEASKTSKNAVIIGGGILGIETAYNLSLVGITPTVIDFSKTLLSRQLDSDSGKLLQEILEEKNIKFLNGESVKSVEEEDGIISLTMQSGKQLSADMVIVSAGIAPCINLALEAGLKTNRGIIVDNQMQTLDKDIYAAGDCAEHNGVVYGLWMPSMQQGQTAGANMVGASKEYKGSLLSHRLKVAGVDLVSAGCITDGAEDFIKKGPGFYKKALITDKKITGCILLGDISAERQITRAINEKTDFSDVRALFE